ncbi:DUF3597 family protein [Clostridioides difficile]|nr:DUF3597 family protein [Clostridioides difficile]MDI6385206.1 DUF3597 family protein [Clostridioides difficile]HBG2429422.1 DUF3597 family protein [Clostridioides difficile]
MDIEQVYPSKKGSKKNKNFFMIAVGGVAFLGIVALFKSNSSDSGGGLEQPSGYDGYPQIADNTESIMNATTQLLNEALAGQNESIKDLAESMKDQTQATQEMINSQFELIQENNKSQLEMFMENMDLLKDSFTESMSYVQEQNKSFMEQTNKIAQSISDTASKVNETVNKIPSEIPTKAPEKKPEENKKKPLISSGYKGVSIVDALKYSGVDSSMANRKKLAEKMGIKGYKGTAKQNDLLLKLLRQGGA